MKNKQKGLRGQLESFRHAFAGVWECLRQEGHMRFHLLAAAAVLAAGIVLRFSPERLAILCMTIGAVLAAEAVNSALERLCDLVRPERDERVRVIKDMAAGAVLLTAIASVGVAVCLFIL